MTWKSIVLNVLTANNPLIKQRSFKHFVTQHLSKNILFQHPGGKNIGITSFIEHTKFWERLFPKMTRSSIRIQGEGNIIICNWITKASHFGKERNNQTISFSEHAELTFNKDKLTNLVICPDLRAIIDNTTLSIDALLRKEIAYFQYDRDSLFDILKTISEPALSKREVECLAFLFSGFSAKQAATYMKLSLKTVETHLNRCYFKLKCDGKCGSLELMQQSKVLYLWHELSRHLLEKDDSSL